VSSNISSYSWSEQVMEEKVVFDPVSWKWVTKSYKYLDTPQPQPVMHNASTYNEAQASANAGATDFGAGELDAKTSDKGQPCDNRNAIYNRYDGTLENPEMLWSSWNVQPTWEEFPDITRPVCDKRLKAVKDTLPNGGEIPPQTPDHSLPPGFSANEYTLTYPTVKQVYGCTQEATIQMTFPSDWSSGGGSNKGEDKAPQKMEDDVELGTETFQIRGIVANFGDRRPKRIDQGLHDAAFERKVEMESWVGAARLVGKVEVAQAEYYFNHDGVNNKAATEWMWNMDWRARLVRFRIPSDDNQQQNNSNSNNSSSMGLASLSSTASSSPSVNISSIPLPEGAPSLSSIEQMIVH